MKNLIETKMEEIFNDLKEELEDYDTLCDLKECRYNGGNIPDYNESIIQQLYLLRYFPAYLVEYYDIYNEVYKQNHIELPYNVLSIGAGCGLDYYGLYLTLQDHEEDIAEYVYYTGLDKVQWNYRDTYDNDDCIFIDVDIDELEEFPNNEYNIIIFPKSIGELSNNTFDHLLEVFENTKFTEDKLVIISSVREQNDETDITRLERVIDCLKEHYGYESMDKEREYTHYTKDVGLKKYFPDFYYPDDIKDFITQLIENCSGYINNGEVPCKDDCKYLNKEPILRTKHIKYQIIRLYRELE